MLCLSKHDSLIQCSFNVGPPSTEAALNLHRVKVSRWLGRLWTEYLAIGGASPNQVNVYNLPRRSAQGPW